MAVKGNNARGGEEGDCQEAAVSREQSMSQQSIFFKIYILQSTVMPWRPQQMKPLYCVCFINQAARSHYFLTEELPAKTAGILLKNPLKKHTTYLYFKENLGNLCPWRACQYEQLLPPPYIWFITTIYKNLLFSLPDLASSVGFVSPQGLLLFALKSYWKLSLLENIAISQWLAMAPTSHSSQPLLLCLLHFLGTHAPLHAYRGTGKAAPSPATQQLCLPGRLQEAPSAPQKWWEHLTLTTQTLWGGQVQVLQDPLAQQMPLISHTTYQKGFSPTFLKL